MPKANLHYYFPTKENLYRSVIERVLTAWLAAASSFDTSDDPRLALSAYIGAKMDLAREMPLATRIWSAEVMRGAPMIQDFLETTLTEWVASRERVVRRWIAVGKLKPIEPKFLFYMIWATTQQYANAAHEMATLNKGRPLDDKAFERAKTEVIEIILRGVAAVGEPIPSPCLRRACHHQDKLNLPAGRFGPNATYIGTRLGSPCYLPSFEARRGKANETNDLSADCAWGRVGWFRRRLPNREPKHSDHDDATGQSAPGKPGAQDFQGPE